MNIKVNVEKKCGKKIAENAEVLTGQVLQDNWVSMAARLWARQLRDGRLISCGPDS
jgi:hypothetical protein